MNFWGQLPGKDTKEELTGAEVFLTSLSTSFKLSSSWTQQFGPSPFSVREVAQNSKDSPNPEGFFEAWKDTEVVEFCLVFFFKGCIVPSPLQ